MDPVVTIGQGQLRGAEKNGVLSFKGIPYAAAPFGANRFAAPQPAPEWEGVRDALEYGPTCPRALPGRARGAPAAGAEDPGRGMPEPERLDPWPRRRRRVPFWCGSTAAASPMAAARSAPTTAPASPVTGWSSSPSTTASAPMASCCSTTRPPTAVCSTRSRRCAGSARTSRRSAAIRARSRSRGESAGAMSVTTLLSMPAAEGLFQRAIAQSGAGQHVTPRGRPRPT